MAGLARCPNVFLKLGGIGIPMMAQRSAVEALRSEPNDAPPSSEELADYWGDRVRWCIELFGVDRCMFESNFPIDRIMCSYLVVWNTFKRIASGASPAEKEALFRGTARKAYYPA